MQNKHFYLQSLKRLLSLHTVLSWDPKSEARRALEMCTLCLDVGNVQVLTRLLSPGYSEIALGTRGGPLPEKKEKQKPKKP